MAKNIFKVILLIFVLSFSLLLFSCQDNNNNQEETSYNIIYYYDYDPLKINISDKTNIPNELISRKGYIFNGAYTSRDGEGLKIIDEKGQLMNNLNIAQDISLYAYWTPKTYKLKFMDDTNLVKEINIKYDEYLSPALFLADTKEHYEFKGWYYGQTYISDGYVTGTNKDYLNSTGWDFDFDKQDTIVLNATYVLEKHKVTFEFGGFATGYEIDVEYGTPASLPNVAAELEKYNKMYEFDGFYYIVYNEVGQGIKTKYTNQPITSNTTLTASYKEFKNLTLHLENTSTTVKVYGDMLLNELEEISKGYTNIHIYTDIDKQNEIQSYDFNSNNKDFYVTREKIDYSIKYFFKGQEITNQNFVSSYQISDQMITLPQDESLFNLTPGYKLVAWFDNSECSGQKITHINPYEVGNKIYYATEEIIYYQVKLDQGNIKQISVSINGIKDDLKPIANKTDYIFTGYFDKQAIGQGNRYIDEAGNLIKSVNSDLTLYAHFVIANNKVLVDNSTRTLVLNSKDTTWNQYTSLFDSHYSPEELTELENAGYSYIKMTVEVNMPTMTGSDADLQLGLLQMTYAGIALQRFVLSESQTNPNSTWASIIFNPLNDLSNMTYRFYSCASLSMFKNPNINFRVALGGHTEQKVFVPSGMYITENIYVTFTPVKEQFQTYADGSYTIG